MEETSMGCGPLMMWEERCSVGEEDAGEGIS